MSLLAPLFFAGALAIGLPILFHLIRRQPKSEVTFSSLMFLDPTPPRLTRRSRLDQLPLLLIRSLVLILLAIAFARPFLRTTARSEVKSPPSSTIVLIDTSASMQRAGLWQQAIARANEVVALLQPDDQIAIVSFDGAATVRMSFDESTQSSIEIRQQNARSVLAELTPTWLGTDMATALAFASEVAVGETQIVLISDMQSGTDLERLQSVAWPEKVRVTVRRVKPAESTNAAAFLVTGDPATQFLVNEKSTSRETQDARPTNALAPPEQMKVRVTNAAESDQQSFSIGWGPDLDVDTASVRPPSLVPVQVPPGQSRTVSIPAPPSDATELRVDGDDHDFDNVRYFHIDPPIQQTVGFVGEVAEQPETPNSAGGQDPRERLFYYFRRVPMGDSSREITVEAFDAARLSADLSADKVPLIVVAKPLETGQTDRLKSYVQLGGRLLFVMDDADSAKSLAATIGEITGETMTVDEAEKRDYHMWSRIDFSDPLFRPMADPQFNDFTKVRFWSHRSVSGLGSDWKVVAQFDDADVAIARKLVGEGELMLATFGWQPSSSQLALSTKFIPLVAGWLGPGEQRLMPAGLTVGDSIPLSFSPTATITTPSGETFGYREEADAKFVDRPGIYTWKDGESTRRFAVNLSENESQTEPMDEEVLKRFGVQVGPLMDDEQAQTAHSADA